MAQPPPFVKVPLGTGHATRVHEPRLLKHVQSTLRKALGLGPHDRIVPPLPISPEAHHKSQIQNGSYAYSEKCDGVRHLLVMLVAHIAGDWRRICILWGRNGDTLIVSLSMADRLFDNPTVLDCELVRCWDTSWALMAFDAFMLEGEPVAGRAFSDRMVVVQRVIDEGYVYSPADPFKIQVKRFYTLRSLNAPRAIERILANTSETRNFDYPTDGVIVVKTNAPAFPGTNSSIFKFKITHTIDLQIVKAEDADDAYDLVSAQTDHGKHVQTSHARLPGPLPPSLAVGDIVECACMLDGESITIIPEHVRRDKSEPNATWVVHRTFQTVRDALDIRELLQ